MRAITPKDAARELRCKTEFILQQIRDGILVPVIRVNARVVLIPEETFKNYMKKKTSMR